MSHASLDLVKEFFFLNRFLVFREEETLLVRNPVASGDPVAREPFLLRKGDVPRLRNALVRPVGWHTLRFAPSVLKGAPEIFSFVRPSCLRGAEQFFNGEPFERILVIPGLPATTDARDQSIRFMREKGITHVLEFPTLLAGMIEKINPRRVYASEVVETMRILKSYELFPDGEPSLPFEEQ